MSRSTLFFILFLTFVAGLLGWNYLERPLEKVGHPPTSVEPSPTDTTVSSAEQIAARLSTREKIMQLVVEPVTLPGTSSASAEVTPADDFKPGFVILFGQNISYLEAQAKITLFKEHYSTSDLPLQVMVDHEGGSVQRLAGAGFTDLPGWQTLCSQPASQSAQLLQTSAQELKEVGVDIALAPVVDVASTHPVLKTRVCSSQPEVVVERAAGYIEAFQAQGILPVLKHFPGIGQTTKDLHRSFDQVTIQPQDALLYRFLLDRYPQVGVMVTHVGVTNQYPDLPCSLSLDCVKELVSHYSQVLVMSDDLSMASARFNSKDVTQPKSLSQVALSALKAGNQVLVFGPGVDRTDLEQVVADLVQAYDQDAEFKAQVDTSLNKVIEYKTRGDL